MQYFYSTIAAVVILYKSFFLVTWQKMPIFRKPEKKNLRKLVHRASICATFKKHTWNLNTLYYLYKRASSRRQCSFASIYLLSRQNIARRDICVDVGYLSNRVEIFHAFAQSKRIMNDAIQGVRRFSFPTLSTHYSIWQR